MAELSPLLIWGGGGHGKVVADIARAAGWSIVGFADADAGKLDMVVEPGGGRVTMGEAELIEELASDALPAGLAIALGIGDNARRLASFARGPAARFPALAHPGAIISPSAALGAGTIAFPRAVVNAAARVGRAVVLNTGSVVEHDCVIGDGAHIAPGSTLCGAVHVGARTLIGAGSTVAPGVRIGADVVVGAGSVVIRDVAPGCVVAGNPARTLRG